MKKTIMILTFIAVFLMACSSDDKDTSSNVENTEDNDMVNNADNIANNMTDNENGENNDQREEFSPGDDVELKARVEINEESNQLVVEGETNLLTATNLTADLIGNPMGNRDYIDRDIHMEVQPDGSFVSSFDLDDEFFQENN